MSDPLFELPRNAEGSLQSRIREMLVRAILDGHLPAGAPLPSGRKLAQQLHVARNTVVQVYQHLVDEGFLVSRERSGYFVNGDILKGRVSSSPSVLDEGDTDIALWRNRFRFRPSQQRNNNKPGDWQRFAYPFVYGQFDPALFPVADWRECSRDATSRASINAWASDSIDQDNRELIEQIHTRVLPRRGVWAHPDEILITLGAQQSLYLLADLLVTPSTTVGMENPGYTDARNIFLSRTERVNLLEVDADGLRLGKAVDQCDGLFVTPSHQFPTTVTMSRERRVALLEAARVQDFFVIEDDYESELNFIGEPTPALKSLDSEGLVIYVGSLSKTLAPGLRMGFMVGPKELIREARALRRLMMRHPPANNQLIVARFLRRGYHDSLVRRLGHALRDRWQIMTTSLQTHLPNTATIPTFGGSSFWVRGPDNLDARELQKEAAAHGILFEAGDIFFGEKTPPKNFFRLGFSSITANRIDSGIDQLAKLVRQLTGQS